VIPEEPQLVPPHWELLRRAAEQPQLWRQYKIPCGSQKLVTQNSASYM